MIPSIAARPARRDAALLAVIAVLFVVGIRLILNAFVDQRGSPLGLD